MVRVRVRVRARVALADSSKQDITQYLYLVIGFIEVSQ